MTIRGTEVKQLCTAAELQLYQASLSRSIKKLDKRELDKKIARSRQLRDKYRGLADRQRREARNKQQPKSTRRALGNLRTRRKQQLFAEILARLEKQRKVVVAADRTKQSAVRGGGTKKKAAAKRSSRNNAAVKKTAAKSSRVAGKRPIKKTKKSDKARKVTTKSNKSVAAKASPAKTRKKGAGTKPKTKVAGRAKTTSKIQLEASTKAKRNRLDVSGQKRTRSHLAGTAKRRQARRDQR